MIFIWGFRLFGKVDEVPGVFHVASRFFHIWYVPLIPAGSQLVLGKARTGVISKSVPFRIKSVILAWLRALCVLGVLFFGWQSVMALTELNQPIPQQPSFVNAPAPASGPTNPVGVPPGTPNQAPVAAQQPGLSDRTLRIITAIVMLVITGIFLLAAIALWKLKWLRRASYKRAMFLCEHAKLSDEARIKIELHFGRISEADAQAALAAAAADREEMEKLAEEAPA